MKVKMLISMLVAGFLALSMGYAIADDNATDTDSNTAMSGVMNGTAMSGTGDMGTTNDTPTEDTTTSDDY